MDGYVKWSSLALFVIMASVVGLCVYLILLIRNLNESVKVLRNILNDNKGNIDETLKNMPVISKNVAEITDTAKNELKVVETAIHSIGATAEYTAVTAETVKDDIIGRLKNILDMIDFVKRLILKFTRKGDREKEVLKKDEENVNS